MKIGQSIAGILIVEPSVCRIIVLFYLIAPQCDSHCLLVDHRAFYLGFPLTKVQINFNPKGHIKLNMYNLIKYFLNIVRVH
jgi:hypothetical protein